MHIYKLSLLLLVFVSRSFGQVSYWGTIDKYPIELLVEITEGHASGIYVYTNFDDPIPLEGKLVNGNLMLYENNQQQGNTATFTFSNYINKDEHIEGVWKDPATGKKLKVNLTQNFDVGESGNGEWKDREMIQPVSLKKEYFKLLLSKGNGDASPRVTGIKIIEKKTDRLIQRFDLDGEFRGFSTMSLGDFNFDGFTDFSIFESGYAGPNTSSLYFLYNPKTKLFFNSGFTGVSLMFDKKTKTITEHHQCCAGSRHTTAIYKVVNNKMVLIKQHCYVWNDKKNMLVERSMKYCE